MTAKPYRIRAASLAAAVLAFLPGLAQAQDSTTDRMRDALRQAVSEMRAAQDQAAQAQADLQKAQAEKADLQKQLDAANARVTEAPKAPPLDVGVLKAQIAAAQQAAQALQAQNAKLQQALQSAGAVAERDGDQLKQASAAYKSQSAALTACEGANTKLIGVSEDVLHLYETQSFRALLLKSYEPVLGLAKVKLQNIVQDYDDKIQNQAYAPPAK